jgi:hypothetical protein
MLVGARRSPVKSVWSGYPALHVKSPHLGCAKNGTCSQNITNPRKETLLDDCSSMSMAGSTAAATLATARH